MTTRPESYIEDVLSVYHLTVDVHAAEGLHTALEIHVDIFEET